MKTTYKLRRSDGKAVCYVIAEGQRERMLEPKESLKIISHSPDGFEFGYGGSGPSQLALAILLDFCQQNRLAASIAQRHYMDLKWKFIATATQMTDITGEQISEFLKASGVGIQTK